MQWPDEEEVCRFFPSHRREHLHKQNMIVTQANRQHGPRSESRLKYCYGFFIYLPLKLFPRVGFHSPSSRSDPAPLYHRSAVSRFSSATHWTTPQSTPCPGASSSPPSPPSASATLSRRRRRRRDTAPHSCSAPGWPQRGLACPNGRALCSGCPLCPHPRSLKWQGH